MCFLFHYVGLFNHHLTFQEMYKKINDLVVTDIFIEFFRLLNSRNRQVLASCGVRDKIKE
jgi:hypothetical protein